MDQDFLDKFLLALCVWREARGESLRGKKLVASVIINRTRDDKRRWGRDIRSVILQPLQFSSFNLGEPNSIKFPQNTSDWIDSAQAAEEAVAGTLASTANHYHAILVTPTWADPTKIVAKEGNHIFYKL